VEAGAVSRLGTTRVVAIRAGAGLLAGLHKGRVRFLAVYDRRALRAAAGVRLLTGRSLSG
jgi:hypothetical protein